MHLTKRTKDGYEITHAVEARAGVCFEVNAPHWQSLVILTVAITLTRMHPIGHLLPSAFEGGEGPTLNKFQLGKVDKPLCDNDEIQGQAQGTSQLRQLGSSSCVVFPIVSFLLEKATLSAIKGVVILRFRSGAGTGTGAAAETGL